MSRGLPRPWKRFNKPNGSFQGYVTMLQGKKQNQVFLAEGDASEEEIQRQLLTV